MTESDHHVEDVCTLEQIVIMVMAKVGASASRSTRSVPVVNNLLTKTF